MTRLNDQRRMWKYIIFSLLTFGIYGIYLEWTMINDMNIACGYKERDDSITALSDALAAFYSDNINIYMGMVL